MCKKFISYPIVLTGFFRTSLLVFFSTICSPLPRIVQILAVILLLNSSVAAAGDEHEQHFRQARSPKITRIQIQKLMTDPVVEVREALARNRKLKPVDLIRLASDPNERVRIAVATNLSTDNQTFLLLAKDRNESVRSVVARFEYVPAEVLAALAMDRSANIRLEVARNLNTLPPTLKQLLNDPDPEVKAIAGQALQRLENEGI